AKTLAQVNAKLCDDVIDYELKIAERDVSLNELKQKLADKFSFTSDDEALAVLERYGHNETGNGIIKADMRSLDDMCRAAVAYLCAEWDFVFQDTVELNREALEAENAAKDARIKGKDAYIEELANTIIDLEAKLAAAEKVRKAAEHVVWFDWSDNDDDAVKAVSDLRS
ncbi:hypothetical protein CEJ88_15860, partial [Staphylococcus aureus]|uniref:hypothetical protein n=1 Tax=Staphylococcus aureus TaxID=1280 RepID=UPI000B663387